MVAAHTDAFYIHVTVFEQCEWPLRKNSGNLVLSRLSADFFIGAITEA